MSVTKLATVIAVATTLSAPAAFGQAVSTTGLQQPGAFTPAAPSVAKTAHATTGVRQPESETPVATKSTALPVELRQPQAFSVPSTYTSYYDENEADDSDDSDVGIDEYSGDVCYSSCDDDCCDCGGFISQGFTFNGYDPRNRFNGPVVMNDRANEYQMNQLWLYMEREVENGGCGWDHGGRVDVVYGTDARFMKMEDGLEEDWDQNDYYQVALLRFYYEVAFDDWNLKAGRMDAPVGYEPWENSESFFYSRSYNFAAQPGSMLALYLTRHLSDQFSLSAGLHRGSDQFDDRDGKDALDFVGGGSWKSCDEETWLDVYTIAEEKGPGNNTLHYAVFGGTALSECWDYVVEWYYGHSQGGFADGETPINAEWYGLNQHLYYEINDCWSYGVRFEWFRDDDGFVIAGFDPRNVAQGPFIGDFYELTMAINYTPYENFVLRPEIRWDWYKADVAGGPHPFDDGTRNNQFIASIDATWIF